MENNTKAVVKDTKVKKVLEKSKHTNIFMIATKENGKKIIVMGSYQASEKEFNSTKEAETYIASKPYELILNMYLIHKDYEEKYKKEMAENVENSKEKAL